MHIVFFYESGKIDGIGMGHKYRVKELVYRLERKGHKISYITDDVVEIGPDVMVIDHIHSQKSLIARGKHSNMKIVLIDGHEDDVELSDLSISAFFNQKAKYRGFDYIMIPVLGRTNFYSPYSKRKYAFVSLGGYDKNNLADMVLKVLDKLQINAIVTKSINHEDFKKKYSRIEVFTDENYYDAMNECKIGITNGGATFFQALHYGLPCVAIPQYEHQKDNISYLSHCCYPCEPKEEDLEHTIKFLWDNEQYRVSVSMLASRFIDGKGIQRACDLIDGLK